MLEAPHLPRCPVCAPPPPGVGCCPRHAAPARLSEAPGPASSPTPVSSLLCVQASGCDALSLMFELHFPHQSRG